MPQEAHESGTNDGQHKPLEVFAHALPSIIDEDRLNAADRARAETLKKEALGYYKRGDYETARHLTDEALRIDDLDYEILMLHGTIAHMQSNYMEAAQAYERALKIRPHSMKGWLVYANELLDLQMYEEASRAYQRVLREDPDNFGAQVNNALCTHHQGHYASAHHMLKRALILNPDHAHANYILGTWLSAANRDKEAITSFTIAYKQEPSNAAYLIALANAYVNDSKSYHNKKEARTLYEDALQRQPNNTYVLAAYAQLLLGMEQQDEALKIAERLLTIAPNDVSIMRKIVGLYAGSRQYEKIIKISERCLQLSDNDNTDMHNHAIALRDAGRYGEAEEYYIRSMDEEGPNRAYTFNNLAGLMMEMGNTAKSLEYYEKGIEADPLYKNGRSNYLFYCNYLDLLTPEQVYDAHCLWEQWYGAYLLEGSLYFPNDPTADRVIKVGYVSADFIGHSVFYFIENYIKHHDPKKIHITCYANVSTPDYHTQELRKLVPDWRTIYDVPDEEVLRMIRKDEIDILVDLSGHTSGNKMDIFSRKPAPIQVTWIGYPNTTGLSTIDYRFCDEVTDPTGVAERYMSETPWRLPKIFTCYRNLHDSTPPADMPVDRNGYITFASFNNSSKISPMCSDMWCRILKAVPKSKIILKSSSLGDKESQRLFTKRFSKHGIKKERLIFMSKLPTEEHMALYDEIDIALDTTPYNGTTTTCETLFMGVPVIALKGQSHVGRVSASLLSQMGLADIVGDDPDAYVTIAVSLATDKERLRTLRQDLKQRFLESSVCQAEERTQDVDDAYCEMWRLWCEQAPKRTAERKACGWPTDAPYKPSLPLLKGLSSLPLLQLEKCLSVMDGVGMVSGYHPLGFKAFHPLHQVQERFNVFNDEEWKIISKRDYSDKEYAYIAHDRIVQAGKKPFFMDWSHLNYIGAPFLSLSTGYDETNKTLETSFTIKPIYTLLHPIDLWLWQWETIINGVVPLNDFISGYAHYVNDAMKGDCVIYLEDFMEKPDKVLREICDYSGIAFDPTYKKRWAASTHHIQELWGLSRETTQYQKMIAQKLGTMPDFDGHDNVREHLQGNRDFQQILDLTRYT